MSKHFFCLLSVLISLQSALGAGKDVTSVVRKKRVLEVFTYSAAKSQDDSLMHSTAMLLKSREIREQLSQSQKGRPSLFSTKKKTPEFNNHRELFRKLFVEVPEISLKTYSKKDVIASWVKDDSESGDNIQITAQFNRLLGDGFDASVTVAEVEFFEDEISVGKMAIKEKKKRFATHRVQEEFLSNFCLEVAVLEEFSDHPNYITFFGAATQLNNEAGYNGYYLGMEVFDFTLSDAHLSTHFSEQQINENGIALFEALSLLHQQHLIEIDLHLNNIGIKDGRFLIFDVDRVRFNYGKNLLDEAPDYDRCRSDILSAIYTFFVSRLAIRTDSLISKATQHEESQAFLEISGLQMKNQLLFEQKIADFFNAPTTKKFLDEEECELFARNVREKMHMHDIASELRRIHKLRK
jgi:hypothetical protein